MTQSKVPIKLVWQLLGKIFYDLDIYKLQESLFINIDFEPSNCYELFYGLILRLLDATFPIHKNSRAGVSDNLCGIDLDMTISENTLRDCQVYSKTYKYTWLCIEHKVFLKALQICEKNSSSKFIHQKSIRSYVSNFCKNKCLSSLNTDMDTNRALDALSLDYDILNDSLRESSILLRNNDIYHNLCRFSYLVLASECQTTNVSGSLSINYKRLDWFIVQQYGVREVWNIINSYKSLNGKKHREFQPIIFSGNSPSLKPDAIYIFDDCDIADCIVDVKLYCASCLDTSNNYRFSNVVNQLVTYKMMYPNYIFNHERKSSRKNLSYSDVNVWALHFRNSASRSEKLFSGTRLDILNIGVFIIDMFEGCTIKDLDNQMYNFVTRYILNIN